MQSSTSHNQDAEMWAGVECTVNRVGDRFFTQLDRNGHQERASDLDLFAGLGIKKIRYPVLWERTAPHSIDECDWRWSDERLARLKTLNIDPIVGLLHHGSGPIYTNLEDPAFPEKLAMFAEKVGRRYPWVTSYTPVNEPLTTARFSGLYGHWYPHGRSSKRFISTLINQCKGIVLAMQALKRINSDVKLVQTEDCGKVFSTPKLTYQATFENHRRWLSFDLLMGRVNSRHPLFKYLLKYGACLEDLLFFCDNPMPPDIFGINHYVTSDRFLDDNVGRYPESTVGGNSRHSYADIESVRVASAEPFRMCRVLDEVWQRYKRPMAITEVHLGCTRDEQLRWLKEVWDSIKIQRSKGQDVRAMTVWSILGAYDWNSLLTEDRGSYEPGLFDVSTSIPRPTALVHLTKSLATGTDFEHSHIFDEPGWWLRPERLIYEAPKFDHQNGFKSLLSFAPQWGKSRPVLITGANGTLGGAFARLCKLRGLSYRLVTRQEMDIASKESVRSLFNECKPWAVINAAGYVRVDDAETQMQACLRENTLGPAVLAEVCAEARIKFLTFSSDLVFDGVSEIPYLERDPVKPLNTYGRSKAEAEVRVLELFEDSLVVRTSAFFGPWDTSNFVTQTLNALRKKEPLFVADDFIVSPTYVPDLVNSSLDLLLDGERGLWHLANKGSVTWAEFAVQAALIARIDHSQLIPGPGEKTGWIAARPKYSVLGSERGSLLPALDNALERYINETQH